MDEVLERVVYRAICHNPEARSLLPSIRRLHADVVETALKGRDTLSSDNHRRLSAEWRVR